MDKKCGYFDAYAVFSDILIQQTYWSLDRRAKMHNGSICSHEGSYEKTGQTDRQTPDQCCMLSNTDVASTISHIKEVQKPVCWSCRHVSLHFEWWLYADRCCRWCRPWGRDRSAVPRQSPDVVCWRTPAQWRPDFPPINEQSSIFLITKQQHSTIVQHKLQSHIQCRAVHHTGNARFTQVTYMYNSRTSLTVSLFSSLFTCTVFWNQLTGCLQLLEILEISWNFVDAPGKSS